MRGNISEIPVFFINCKLSFSSFFLLSIESSGSLFRLLSKSSVFDRKQLL